MLLLTSLLAAAPALAQMRPPPTIGRPAFKVPPSWCQMGTCITWTIEEINPILFSSKGVLFRVQSQTWEGPSDTNRRTFTGMDILYVFCSTVRPAVIERQNGVLHASVLAPNDADVYGHANEIRYRLYFAVCHGKDFDDGASSATYARSIGYRVPEERDDVPVKRPEDIATLPDRGS
jgi:hypothetical protein